MAKTGDVEDHAILDEVLSSIGNFDELSSIGPVTRDPKTGAISCPVTVTDINHPNVARSQKPLAAMAKRVNVTVQKGHRVVFCGVCPGEENNPAPPPLPPSTGAPFMGGDGCWPVAAPYGWGTIALAAHKIKIRSGTGAGNTISVTDGCLSCGHIFGWQAKKGDVISAPGFPNAMTFEGALPVVGAARPVDAALAKLTDRSQAILGAVRGFGDINGVKAPTTGMWISKNGAKSTVTAGLDKGPITISTSDNHIFKGVRRASPGLICCHDSGAAILDQKKRFVGMAFAVEDRACNLRPYGFYIPARKFGDPVNANIFDLEIDIQN